MRGGRRVVSTAALALAVAAFGRSCYNSGRVNQQGKDLLAMARMQIVVREAVALSDSLARVDALIEQKQAHEQERAAHEAEGER